MIAYAAHPWPKCHVWHMILYFILFYFDLLILFHFCFFETGSHSLHCLGCGLTILLSQRPESWDYRDASTGPIWLFSLESDYHILGGNKAVFILWVNWRRMAHFPILGSYDVFGHTGDSTFPALKLDGMVRFLGSRPCLSSLCLVP
jgi:hypothetical protein